ncbi:WD40 repeat-like protein [Suhomyces tanzawaensis NRRL Y-17324]|uniref:DNA damage-binding protein CMR1 n=1 Tax=Suhomyces tanzawaensis NRRL Y-17324 TaxID=984487 RepID=A0A1E4SRF5_9ASCO|nr:WD40 repeat-like protein [Suhomyces tanzawaensis NRRL Y-17324]ODV82093.1 WD40 repeat-like protein [Suhomyces tanzawaensis NRRL Y-17324]
MAPLSDFEKQRQANIQRNKDLLKQLELDSISSSIKRELPKKDVTRKKRKTEPKAKEPAEPSRRSRRIAGIKTETENPEEFARIQEEIEEKERKRKELEELKRTRLFGDFKLIDLITDKKLGHLKFEDKVIKQEGLESVKEEPSDEIADIDDDNKVLQVFKSLGSKFSAGDFYNEIRDTISYNDEVLETKRKEFDDLKIYQKFDPLDIKISHYRITSINFHPSTTDRVVMAGDTNGNVGIWAVDSKEEDEPTISILKPHGKSISRILTPNNSPSKIYTSSYDGSVRELDLNKLESSELAYLSDPWESGDYSLGVSDINLCKEGNPNILYMTTLLGNFYQHDIREAFKPALTKSLLRLHDKKIGSFSINPNLSYQVATASLDRTLRIWDLRNLGSSKWSDFENQTSPHMYGSYSSRLSVSCVDWNIENRLVCNGYDDNIALFDYNGTKELSPITQWASDYVVPSKDEEIVPDNLTPFTKIRHNCQTGRWVSILKSKWQTQPEDGVQKFVIANMNRGVDIYDQKGQIIAHLSDSVGAVPAVSTLHPSKNWVVGGSASGKVYLFE